MARDESKAKGKVKGTTGTTRKRARKLTTTRRTLQRKRSVIASTSTKTQLPNVAIVGAGRLGTALALALAAHGYQVNALVARRRSSAQRAARLFKHPQPIALDMRELAALPHAIDLLLITTPDDQIAATAARLAQSELARSNNASDAHAHNKHARKQNRCVVLHTSGALSSAELAELRACGFAVGSLHPLVSVSDARAGAESLSGAYYCVEGDGAAVRAARKLVRALAGHSFSIKPADKALYHAAAVLAAGHTVALFDLAAELLAHCGVTRAHARRALSPLTYSTLTNLLAAHDPARALTGPFARGDAATIRKSLAALGTLTDSAARNIYALLGAHALRLARTKGAHAAEIEAALNSVLAAMP